MLFANSSEVLRFRIALGFVGVLAATATAAPPVQRKPHEPPKGLSASDWSGIRAAHNANRHAALAVEGGYVARNPGQQWRMRFDGRGFVVTPDAGGHDGGAPAWTWGLELVSVGRGDAPRAVSGPACVDAQGGRVEYEWDATLSEWYVNDPSGLEHGYTVRARPDEQLAATLTPSGDAARAEARGSSGLMTILLAVRGDLRPRVSRDGRDVAFVNDAGWAVVKYDGLTVLDAAGIALPAWFEPTGEGLRLAVDDRAARYPLTIDPIAQQAYLKASNTEAGDHFGWSVAVSGDTVVVGAAYEDTEADGSGAAYVFVRSGSGAPGWSQQAYLKASNAEADDLFGFSVAVSGDTVVVGAPDEDSNATGVNGDQFFNSAVNSGAAYVFVRKGRVWSQQAYLKASNTESYDHFGRSVAVSGDAVVVGAAYEDSDATGVDGNQADNRAGNSGAAYVFVRSGPGTPGWTQQAYLKASNTGAGDQFGDSVAVSGDTVVVGAYLEDSSATGVNGNQADNSAADSGAAYVFVRSGGDWRQQAYLKASNTGASDNFGWSVAVGGDTVAVGAYDEDSNATGVNGNQADNSTGNSGAAYIFVRSGGVWSQQAYLKASNTGANDQFGWSVAVGGDTVVVGAPYEDSDATGVNGDQADNSAASSGAAYAFARSSGVWSQQAYLKASNTAAQDDFGYSVAVSGDTVVVGAIAEDSNATGVNGDQADNGALESGAAYVFVIPKGTCGIGFCGVGLPTLMPVGLLAFAMRRSRRRRLRAVCLGSAQSGPLR